MPDYCVDNIATFLESYFRRPLDHELFEALRDGREPFNAGDFKVAYAAWRKGIAHVYPLGRDEKSGLWASLDHRVVARRPELAGDLRLISEKRFRTEVRPYLIAEQRPRPGTYAVHSTMFEDARWEAVDAIKHRLLYCHSVAIENPMALWMTEVRNESFAVMDALRRGRFGWPFNARSIIAGWIAFLIELRPAIDTGVVIIVEDRPRDLVHAVRPSDIGMSEKQAEDLRSELGFADVHDVTNAVATLRRLGERRERNLGAFDLEFSDRRLRTVAARQRDGSRGAGGLRRDTDLTLQTLLATGLPSLEHLTFEELVAVRRGSESFEEWRGWLQQIVEQMADETYSDLDPEDRGDALRERFARELRDRKRSLRNEIRESSALSSHVSKRTLGFAIGLATGALLGDPLSLASVAVDAGAEVATGLAEHAWDSGLRNGQADARAQAALFVAFAEPHA